MSTELFRKYIDIIKEAQEEAPAQGESVSQQELAQLYTKGKEAQFIKNTPVALQSLANLSKVLPPEKMEEVTSLLGLVDKTSYDDAYKQNGYVVFQWNSGENKPDLYVASPNVVTQKYTKFDGQLPTDPKAVSKVPSLVVLGKLGIDPSKIPFFVKKVPTNMVSAKSLGLEGKVIQTSWGEQTVQPGGYIVREDNGHIYTVAPDARGLPIGYIKA
jgi:hypothetical protein